MSPKSLHDVLFNYSCLQTLNLKIFHHSGVDSLIQRIFCDSWEQGVWKTIRRVDMIVYYNTNGLGELFNQVVVCQQHYVKRWRKFMVSHTTDYSSIELGALM